MRNLPDAVRRARFQDDKETLSHLGKIGAKRKKAMSEQKKREKERRERLHLLFEELQLLSRLSGSRSMSAQAHEDICPVD